MLGERYDSVRDCLKSEQVEKPKKYCCLAKFVEGSDIARRSVKRPFRNAPTNNVDVRKIFYYIFITFNLIIIFFLKISVFPLCRTFCMFVYFYFRR